MTLSPEFYMRRAIQAAEKAHGLCSPNPFVGAVIVKNNQIIATGHTQCYGCDHAEVQAIKYAGDAANGADLYVTLEPCSHYGKTPPCALAIIKAKLKRVFVGIIDPHPLVSGKGLEMLRDAGIEVHWGILEAQIRRQLESYLCFIQKHRPFVTLKTALSLDGKYAAPDGSSQWITSEKSRRLVHRLRSQHDALITGIGTVLADDPMLNNRISTQAPQPLRVIIDPLLELPLSSKIAQSMHQFPTLIICGKSAAKDTQAKELQGMGAIITSLPAPNGLFDPTTILELLYAQNIVSLMLETGSALAESFLKAKRVDKCLFFYGPLLLGGDKSPYPHLGITNIEKAISFSDLSFRRIGSDLLLTAYPKF